MKTFSLQQSAALTKELTGDLRLAGLRALHSAALRVVQRIVTEIIPGEDPQPVDRGAYRAAWRVRAIADGWVVENVVRHGAFIEAGVRGDRVRIGRKMIDALTSWVIRKGMVGSSSRFTRKRRVTESDRKAARKIAWAIAQNMKKSGIFNRGGRFGLKILERALSNIDVVIREEFAREVDR